MLTSQEKHIFLYGKAQKDLMSNRLVRRVIHTLLILGKKMQQI